MRLRLWKGLESEIEMLQDLCVSHLPFVQILSSSLHTSFLCSSFCVVEYFMLFPNFHDTDTATHTDWRMVSQGPKSKLPGERIQMLSMFHSRFLVLAIPAGVKGHEVPTWLPGATPVRMTGRGILSEVGRRRCPIDVHSITCLSCHSVFFLSPPSHYLGLSSNITSLEKCSLTTLAK